MECAARQQWLGCRIIVFLREVQAHNIVILAEDGFLDRMAALADTVNDDSL